MVDGGWTSRWAACYPRSSETDNGNEDSSLSKGHRLATLIYYAYQKQRNLLGVVGWVGHRQAPAEIVRPSAVVPDLPM
jgi:hypothetical protein